MRRACSIAAMLILASCGGREAENDADPLANAAAGLSNEANLPVEANASDPENIRANTAAADTNSTSTNPCLMQGKDRLDVKPLRATGTEPFWSARIEGRCVIYSTPDDQQGTRLWTRYAPAPNGGGTWSGQFGGRGFELTSRRDSKCSDGMSDKVYPIAVDLMVNGERRQGCAQPG